MKLDDLSEGEIVVMSALDSACSIDSSGDMLGLVQRGHHAPWRIRREAEAEYGDGVRGALYPSWPKRAYMRDMPWSLKYPDDPPCDGGEESVIWEECKRADVGAIPVTVLYFEGAR